MYVIDTTINNFIARKFNVNNSNSNDTGATPSEEIIEHLNRPTM